MASQPSWTQLGNQVGADFMLGPLATLVPDRAVPQGDPAGHTGSPFMFLRGGSRNVMRGSGGGGSRRRQAAQLQGQGA